jgi:hypothetical protein
MSMVQLALRRPYTFIVMALLILIPVAVSLLLVWCFCIETRGRDLRDLERRPVPAH